MSGSEKEYQIPDESVEGNGHHGSHHHHHERRDHHSRQKKKRSKNKLVIYLYEHKKQLAGVAVFLAILIVLTAMIFVESAANREAEGQLVDGTGPTSERPQQQVELTPLTMELPWLPETQCLIGDAAQALMDASITGPVDRVLAPFREADDRLDEGQPVELSFDVVSVPKGLTISSFRVDVWETGAADQVWTQELGARQRTVQIDDLKTGTQYQYHITVYLSDGSSNGITGSFPTAASPRLLSIDGLRNVRDIGGWKTAAGDTIHQGLLYRGSEMDGASEGDLLISDEGRQDMLTKLGIRTDMDLRHEGEGYGALGANVQHACYGLAAYEEIFTEAGGAAVRKVFEDLSDPQSYPVYLHGTRGVDRTGTICYLLEALLGVSEEDLLREYGLSALAYDDVDWDQIGPTIERLKTYGGADMRENAELYLKSVGITQEQIDQIRSIFLQ